MQNIIIDKPYVPMPPLGGRIWPAILARYLPRLIRKKYGVVSVQFDGVDRLKQSLAAGHGILLAPNHSRDEDPFVVGMLSREVRRPLFIMASWHLFMQDRLQTFLLRRGGAFSIYREGIDRAAVNSAVEILETAQRPLVIFPEGYISRTNDHINTLLDGVALIARSAARKRAKMNPPGKVVVHPLAIRYKFEGNIQAAAGRVLDEIETRLTWRPQRQLSTLERIYKTGGALLTLKELEYLGRQHDGTVEDRLQRLMDAILLPLEVKWLGQSATGGGEAPARVKRLRSAILPDMAKGEIDESERQARWKDLSDLYLVQQLHHYPADYVRSNPTPQRLLETIERFEEDLTDKVSLHGPIRATVTLGEPIEAVGQRQERDSHDPLLDGIEKQWRFMLGLDGTT
ncbi:MAG: 1-acyl-sn-glycerol-3-phosphate acyltransferase [Tepidisphaeraceae bacterium]|jgi:1-acyl-sn-glycerol-3-phosphate acyltransferase